MVSEDKKLRAVGSAISLVFIAAALLLFLLSEAPPGAPSSWRAQGVFMIAVSFAAVLPQFVSGNLLRFLILMFFRVLFLLVIGASQGTSTGIELLLTLSVILDFSVILSFPWNWISSLMMILGLLASRRPVFAWGGLLPAPAISDLIAFGVYSTVLVGFLAYVKRTSRELQNKQELSETLGRTVERLIIANLEFQRYASVVEQQSMLSERKRISRDIHDAIGYTLTNIGMMMEAATGLIERGMIDRLQELVSQAGTLARTGHEDTRRALRVIREIDLPEPIRGPFGILKMVRDFENATKVRTMVNFGNLDWHFTSEQEDAIFRFLQEGMTNAFRHGQADLIRIDFWDSGTFWEVVVFDNGIGAPAGLTEGIGLQGMRERIGALGGTLWMKNAADGFVLKAVIEKRRGDAAPEVSPS